MSDLRTRISDMAAEHRFADHQNAFGDKCVCGWTSQDIPHSEHLADAVIRELGLEPERRVGPGEPGEGLSGFIRYVTGWEVDD